MREQDRREIGALVDLSEPAVIAAQLLHWSGDTAHVAYLAGQPVCVFGATVIFPHVLSGWAFGTRRMSRAVPAITRFLMNELGPELVMHGVRRVEVRTIEDHDLSHRWLESMGARCETPEAYEFGRDGERFKTYAWTKQTWQG